MRRSTDYFLSSHGGNLPRPAAFDAKLARFDDHKDEIAAELPGAAKPFTTTVTTGSWM